MDEADDLDAVRWHSPLPTNMSRVTPDFYRTVQSAGAYQWRDKGHAGGKASAKVSGKTKPRTVKPAGKAEGDRKGSATAQPDAHC